MAFDSTIVEQDLDADTQLYLQGLTADIGENEADLTVDGMSESILTRLLGVLGVGRS